MYIRTYIYIFQFLFIMRHSNVFTKQYVSQNTLVRNVNLQVSASKIWDESALHIGGCFELVAITGEYSER